MFAVVTTALAAPGDTTLVSVTQSGGVPSGDSGPSSSTAMSADGRFVLFTTDAPDVVDDDTNGTYDVFLRDRSLGTTVRASVRPAGSGDGPSFDASLSADGRYAAFSSDTTVPGGLWGIFVRDLQLQQTQWIANGFLPVISRNGRYVMFTTFTATLVPGDTNGASDVFLYDRQGGTFERVSLGVNGQLARSSESGAMSADGRFVAFRSFDPHVVSFGVGPGAHLYVRDRQTGTTELVDFGWDGQPAESDTFDPAMSADGRFVSYSSRATNLVPNDTNEEQDVFLFDRQTRTTERISVNSSEQQSPDFSAGGAMSADARYVAFFSEASLAPGGVGGTYVRDRATGQTVRASVDSTGAAAGGGGPGVLSADGRLVAFFSTTKLAASDTNGAADAYLHEFGGDATPSYAFTLRPMAVDFGDQTLETYGERSFVLRNTGASVINVLGFEVRGPAKAMFSAFTDCGAGVGPGETCRIFVNFRPTALGIQSAELKVRFSGGLVRTRQLTGTGVRARFSVAPTALAFGNVAVGGLSAPQSVEIQNLGTSVLPIKILKLDGTNPGQFTRTSNCPVEVAVGSSCTAVLRFRPTSVGTKSAVLIVRVGASAPAKSVALSGTATPP